MPPLALTSPLPCAQETKELNLYLGVGFYGMNLKYVKGAPPPPREAGVPNSHEYDIITRTYVNRATARTWTVDRAITNIGKE